jgi:hypothetical protein
MPEVMNEFYGTFDREKACWISKHEDDGHEDTYCMKPIRLDVRSSSGRRMLFIVAGGQKLEEGIPAEYHAATGVLGLIVLTPRGANFGVVATNNLYEGFETYGRYPRPESVTIHRLGPNGAYGWLAELGDQHSGHDIRWVQVYGVIGNSVELLTTVTSLFSTCGQQPASCSTLSVKYAFQTQSSASSFYPVNYAFRAFTTRARFAATTAWSSIKARSLIHSPKICQTKLSPLPQETKLSRRGSSSAVKSDSARYSVGDTLTMRYFSRSSWSASVCKCFLVIISLRCRPCAGQSGWGWQSGLI